MPDEQVFKLDTKGDKNNLRFGGLASEQVRVVVVVVLPIFLLYIYPITAIYICNLHPY